MTSVGVREHEQPDVTRDGRLTVVVCVKMDPRLLRLLLSLEKQSAARGSFEVVVVYTGEWTYGDLAALDLDVRAVPSPELRLASARKRGLASVTTEFFLTTDADCVASPTLVETLLSAFAAAPTQVVGIGGRIEKLSDNTATRRYGITINDGQPSVQYLPASELPYITGAHAAFRTAAVRRIGGYDERYCVGEDVDVCYRLGLAGGLLQVSGDAVVYHEDRAGLGAHFRRFQWYAVDQALLFKRYAGRPRWLPYVNRYPWRRAASALRLLVTGLPRLLRGDTSAAQAAVVTLFEAAGVWAGDIEGSIRHRLIYL